MPKPTDYDKTHLRNMAAIGTRIDRIFKKAAEEAAKIGVSIKKTLPEDRIFSFDDYPETRKQIERLMTALQESMETTIVNGVRSAWTLSNNKNNALVSRIFGERVGDLSKEQYRRYFSTNGAALDAFLGRKEQGLNLSDRVWRYTNAFKHEIELGLDLGIRSGESAASMTRSLRQYLQYPDKLFRRVRDKHGNLRLSKAAQAFHPGRGVYRSSYKNARRLACTETNIAYRTSDHLRWQQMDFVVGIEIKLSNNHTLNGVPLTDICDTLKGRYPKDFKFVGWHPHCRCHVVTVLKTEEEMQQDTQRILAGEKPKKGSVNDVRDVPAAFKDWVEEHADRIEMGGKLPYFLQDNKRRVDTILGIVSEPQKTPLEIAQERHDARTPEQAAAIQQKWNETRLRHIAEAIDNGYLPNEVKAKLEELLAHNTSEHFEEINARIAFYQKRAKAHIERSPKAIADIKQRWSKKQLRDHTIRTRAENILAEAKKWSEVDYSALEKFVATGNLTKMRDESMSVIKAIRAMRDEEKALADLIPNANLLHKEYTLAEMKKAFTELDDVMQKWLTKYNYSSLDEAPLLHLKNKLDFEITSPTIRYKYKDLIQKALTEKKRIVEQKIEWEALVTQASSLRSFETKSTVYKSCIDKIDLAIRQGDINALKASISEAERQQQKLSSRRAKIVGDTKTALNEEYKGTAVGSDITASIDVRKMTSEDPYRPESFTNNIARMQGFDNPAKLVTPEEFERLEKECEEVFFRTVNDTTFRGKSMTSAEFASQLYKADKMELNGPGGRVYGDGMYVATTSWNGSKTRPITSINREIAYEDSRCYGNRTATIYEMTFVRKPRIIKQEDLSDLWDKLTEEQQEKFGDNQNTFGCALGFDAMYCDGPNYMVIWNRSIIAIKKQ